MKRKLVYLFLAVFLVGIFMLNLNDEGGGTHTPRQVFNLNRLDVTGEDFVQMTDSFYGYSAYFDELSDPSTPTIRIIGLEDPRNYTSEVTCLFYSDTFELMGATSGSLVLTKDPYKKSHWHTLAFVLCEKGSGYPTYVDFEGAYKGHRLQISYQQSNEDPEYKVASCIKPMHSFYEAPLLVVEWLEYHLLLGVEHFTFYNFSIGPLTTEVLRSYPEVKVLDWKVPFPGKGNPVFGQLVSLTECAHRYRGRADFVLNLDLDEFLIPLNSMGGQSPVKNVTGDGKVVETPENPPLGYVSFFEKLWEVQEQKLGKPVSNCRFESKVSFDNSPMKELNFPGSQGEEEKGLRKLRIATRTHFLDAGQRKFVYRPKRLVESGIHFSPFAVEGTATASLGKGDGYYLHFRDCQKYFHKRNGVLRNNATCLQTTGYEEDTYALDNVGPVLVLRVMKKVEELSKKLGLDLNEFFIGA